MTLLDRVLDEHDHDPADMLAILEETQEVYGYLPVAALKRISQLTGAWYATIYGTATYYSHLRFEPAEASVQAAAMDARRPSEASYLAALEASLGTNRRARRQAQA
jgi:NADH-quinone oxidoreductase subunit E